MPTGGGLQYFSGGMDHEQIKQCLASPDPMIQKGAVMQITANMTVGKDMTHHFSDVARLVSSDNLEIKKVVYLYLIQNAKSQPEKAVLHAGSFVRDSLHDSPLIRGIAIRTMTALQVPAMADFAQGVVLKTLRDTDPYVRRNATVAVVKLHQVTPTIVTETGIIHELLELLNDPVASVVASAVCAICELAAVDETQTILAALTSQITTMLNAMEECTEWSQVYLLEGIVHYFDQLGKQPGAAPRLQESEKIVSRIVPHLQSTNPAVVLSSVAVVVNFMQAFCNPQSGLAPMQQADLERRYSQKIGQPLVSLVSGLRFEIRYVVLRNIKVIVQKYKETLVPYLSSFFVKFEDPIYIKLEKIDVMLALATKANADVILSELIEYAQEIDVDLVRKAVRTVGYLAVKLQSITGQCVERLITLIESRISYVVQEAAVVVQNILRQYPNKYESIVAKLCSAIDVLDDPESKAAVVWVVGEYASRITNSASILNIFFENFGDESLMVQEAVLTATAKFYCAKTPYIQQQQKQETLEKILRLATTAEHPDLVDRAYFYWRLIRADVSTASKVLHAEKDRLVDTGAFDKQLLGELLRDVGKLSSVLHKPVSLVLGDGKRPAVLYDDADEELDEAARSKARHALEAGDTPTAPAAAPSSGGPVGGAINFDTAALPTSTSVSKKYVMVQRPDGNGLAVSLVWFAGPDHPQLGVKFELDSKFSPSPVVQLMLMQINKNLFGLGFADAFPPCEVRSGEGIELALSLNSNNRKAPTRELQLALQSDLGVNFFVAPPIPTLLLLRPAPVIEPEVYAGEFQLLPIAWSLPPDTRKTTDPRALTQAQRLKPFNITLVHSREFPPLVGSHLFATSIGGVKLYAEVTAENDDVVLINTKSDDEGWAHVFGEYLLEIFAQLK